MQRMSMMSAYKCFVYTTILDAQQVYNSDYLKKNRPEIWEEARAFIFDDYRLESFLFTYHLYGAFNCALARKNTLENNIREPEDE